MLSNATLIKRPRKALRDLEQRLNLLQISLLKAGVQARCTPKNINLLRLRPIKQTFAGLDLLPQQPCQNQQGQELPFEPTSCG
jgi:hypothetical protein